MELSITIGALIAGALLVAVMRIRENRSRASFDVPLVPSTPIMFLGILISMLAVIHLLNMYGLLTNISGP